jgi:Protein of unknown function (DUF2569)
VKGEHVTDETSAADEFFARGMFPVDLPESPDEGERPNGEGADAVASPLAARPGPRGIGGWLLWPVLGMVLNLWFLGTGIVPHVRVAMRGIKPGMEVMVWLNVSLRVAAICFTFFALVTVVGRFRVGRWAAIAYFSALVGTYGILAAAWYAVGQPALGMQLALQCGLSILAAAGWTAYFLRSARVRNTLVR